MKPVKVTFYLYADDDTEIMPLENALHNFVMENYRNGILITAKGLTDSLIKYGTNPIIKALLK